MSAAAPSAAGGLDRWLRELGRAVLWRRRLLAAGLLAGAVALALQALAPAPPPGVHVLVAARDLAAGAALGDGDVRRVALPGSAVPAGALSVVTQVAGATVSSAVRRGEVLTDARLAGRASLLGLPSGTVAAPLRLADAETAGLLRPGEVVDVLAAGADGGYGRLVASGVRVLAVPTRSRTPLGFGAGDGALVLVATTSPTAARLAGAAVTDRLSVVIRGQ